MKTHYFIFVRPPGSGMWTLHCFPSGFHTPWRDTRHELANSEAKRIVDNTRYCARVVGVELPDEVDDGTPYALLADGDSMYVAAPQ